MTPHSCTLRSATHGPHGVYCGCGRHNTQSPESGATDNKHSRDCNHRCRARARRTPRVPRTHILIGGAGVAGGLHRADGVAGAQLTRATTLRTHRLTKAQSSVRRKFALVRKFALRAYANASGGFIPPIRAPICILRAQASPVDMQADAPNVFRRLLILQVGAVATCWCLIGRDNPRERAARTRSFDGCVAQ